MCMLIFMLNINAFEPTNKVLLFCRQWEIGVLYFFRYVPEVSLSLSQTYTRVRGAYTQNLRVIFVNNIYQFWWTALKFYIAICKYLF